MNSRGETSWKLALDYAEMERRQTEPCTLAAGRHGEHYLHAQEHIFNSKVGDRIKENWKLAVQIMNFASNIIRMQPSWKCICNTAILLILLCTKALNAQ